MASTTFDFPQPFGPTIAQIPAGNASWTASGKDLNPAISSDRIRKRSLPSPPLLGAYRVPNGAILEEWAGGSATHR